jgi:hypothetical protein
MLSIASSMLFSGATICALRDDSPSSSKNWLVTGKRRQTTRQRDSVTIRRTLATMHTRMHKSASSKIDITRRIQLNSDESFELVAPAA